MTDAQRHTFLVIDDEPDVLDAVRRLFRRDYELHLARTAAEAFAILEAHDIHLVMSDQRMPELSGVELLTRVRREHPSAVRMLFTGYSDLQPVIEAINEGHVYRYIHKPFDPAELKQVVAQAAERWELRRERERLTTELAAKNLELAERNEQIRRAYDELQTLDRLKTVFMEVVSHELNTPTAIIIGYAALLKRDTVKNDAHAFSTAVGGIQGSGKRLKGIAEKILKMLAANSPDVELHPEPVEALGLLEGIREELEPVLVVRHQTLDLDVPAAPLTLEAERDYLYDLLMNLIVNAIKFSPDGNTIWVSATHARLRDEEAVRFQVRDEGIGIQPEDRAQIFNPFFGTFQTKHHSSGEFGYQQRGLGLGLAIVKAFVDMHGGAIEVDSVLGRGSTFDVVLPVHPSRRRAAEALRPGPGDPAT